MGFVFVVFCFLRRGEEGGSIDSKWKITEPLKESNPGRFEEWMKDGT